MKKIINRLTSAFAISLLGFSSAPSMAEVKKSTELLAVDDHSHAKSTAVQMGLKKEYVFQEAGVHVSTDFEGGAFSAIKQIDDQNYTIEVRAENLPINTSPWYAFKIWVSPASKVKSVKLTLNYVGGEDGWHRYNPKTSLNRKQWSMVPADKVKVSEDKTAASFEIPVSTRALWVAAQELMTSSDFKAWHEVLAQKDFVKISSIGKSILGREIPQIVIADESLGDKTDKKILIVMGRQHPPEVTGTLALQGFVGEFVKDTEMAKKFRAKFDVIVYPMINPDGIDEGFWRHNRNGLDLNRDWGPFKQPETRAVRDAIAKFKGRKLAFAIDFHSTFDDVFYLLEDSVKAPAKQLAMDWILGLSKSIPDFTYRTQPVPYSVPGSTNWLNKEYGMATLVYEVGDGTDRIKVKQIAETGANLMAKLLLESTEL